MQLRELPHFVHQPRLVLGEGRRREIKAGREDLDAEEAAQDPPDLLHGEEVVVARPGEHGRADGAAQRVARLVSRSARRLVEQPLELRGDVGAVGGRAEHDGVRLAHRRDHVGHGGVGQLVHPGVGALGDRPGEHGVHRHAGAPTRVRRSHHPDDEHDDLRWLVAQPGFLHQRQNLLTEVLHLLVVVNKAHGVIAPTTPTGSRRGEAEVVWA